ncbi:MAG: helix-turn-helix domain-containing protein [Hyphomicrobiaceae bacterium]
MSPPDSNPVREEFARRLKALRIKRGFKTARSLAQALGIDENRYTRYERFEVEPDLTLLRRICDILGVTSNELLQGPGTETDFASSSFGESSSGEVFGGPSDTVGRVVPPLHAPYRRTTYAEARIVKRRALTWQLAQELTNASLPPEQDPTVAAGSPVSERAFQAFQLTAKIYSEIDADPFAFAMKVGNDPLLGRIDPQQRTRIMALIQDLIAEVNASVLRR